MKININIKTDNFRNISTNILKILFKNKSNLWRAPIVIAREIFQIVKSKRAAQCNTGAADADLVMKQFSKYFE